MITSTKNPRIVEARKLTDRKHRQRQNRFLVEGLQLLSLAVEVMDTPQGQTRVKPLELFYSEELFTGETAPRLLHQLTQAGAEAIPVAPHVLDTLSERNVSQGLAATFALSELEWSLDELQRGGEARRRGGEEVVTRRDQSYSSPPCLLLIFDKLQDPGNLGTLIRTADAVGVQAVILLEPCVDPFDPKTVRGTMGSLFTVPFTRTKNAGEVLSRLAEKGYRLVGADGRQGEPPWQSDVLTGSVALVLGNEARGLSPELRPYLQDYVRLPLRGHAESLNVSVAGGTLMYEWLRVNSEM
ncbi:MAG TPA: RNA methyltransferase [Anaerolineae bacterium]|nr:RNA methyltransferase [Anaerolineae bacterium]